MEPGLARGSCSGVVFSCMYLYDSRRSTDLGNTSERGLGCEESIGRIAQLFDLVRGKLVCPCLWLRAIFLWVPRGRTGDLLRKLLER